MKDLGISVGEWTDNQYANFGSSQDRLLLKGINGFLPAFTTAFGGIRGANSNLYGNYKEIRTRKETAKILLDKGFTVDDISRLWSNYKLDVQSKFDKDKFLQKQLRTKKLSALVATEVKMKKGNLLIVYCYFLVIYSSN